MILIDFGHSCKIWHCTNSIRVKGTIGIASEPCAVGSFEVACCQGTCRSDPTRRGCIARGGTIDCWFGPYGHRGLDRSLPQIGRKKRSLEMFAVSFMLSTGKTCSVRIERQTEVQPASHRSLLAATRNRRNRTEGTHGIQGKSL